MKEIRHKDLVYKEYNIFTDGTWGKYSFSHENYDGPEDKRIGHGNTIEECIVKIQEMIEELEDSYSFDID